MSISLDTVITMHMVERKLGDIICDATRLLEAGKHDLINLVWDYPSCAASAAESIPERSYAFRASHAIGLIRGIAIMMDCSPLTVIAQARVWKVHAPVSVPICPCCLKPTHASDSNDVGACSQCLGNTAVRP